jgi:hypothetical protein
MPPPPRDPADEAARRAQLDRLVPLVVACARLELSATEVHWLVSTRKLPSWLVDGTWRFDPEHLDAWVAERGGLAAVQADVKASMEAHRTAQPRMLFTHHAKPAS